MSDTRYKPLPWTRLTRGVPCYLPTPGASTPVDATTPALEVMTDYRRQPPVTIARNASLDEANRVMTLCKVQYLLVTDERQQLLGIVTEAGTRGNHPLGVAHRMGIRPGELVVGNVMIDRHNEAEVMHLRDVAHAKVGNVVTTMKELGTPFCLVVDHDEEDHHVLCGIFSLSRIQRRMGQRPEADEIAHTFSQVVNTLSH